jgi:hypothetical protein
MAIPEWSQEYQRRIKAARREYLLLKEQQEPQHVASRQGEAKMQEADTDLVQKQLSELAQQVVYGIQSCNKEKHNFEDQFDLLKNGILIMDSRMQTKKLG